MNKRYWLRGGIIGAIVMILIIAEDYVLQCGFGAHQEFCGYFVIMASLPLAPLLFGKLMAIQIFPTEVSMATYRILAVILYLIIGAIIGLIYGKIKNKNKL